jgi:hypothetical protein
MEFGEWEERKLMLVLEFYLSLREADIVFNDIFDKEVTEEHIKWLLEVFHECREERTEKEIYPA